MQIAYLVNQYPKISHSFIRREIIALEKLGVTVQRYSIRPVPVEALSDPEDIIEHAKTYPLLAAGLSGLLTASLLVFMRSPLLFLKAFGSASSMGIKGDRGIFRHWAYLAEACLLKIRLNHLGISHVHAHFGTNSAAVVLLCRLINGPAYSFTVHGQEEIENPDGESIPKKVSLCQFVVAVSDFGRSQLMRHCDYADWHKIKVVRCTVDDQFLNSPKQSFPEDKRLVCVGRLCPQKGHLLLLEALHTVAEEGITFEMIFAGDGELRPLLEKRIQELALTERIKITGWLSGEEVRREISRSRALVLPSLIEGLPVVIMEAFALGRPVLSTYIAGIPELVKEGENGWIIPAGSVTLLAEKIREILEMDSGVLAAMGLRGTRSVKERHNASTEAGKLKRLFLGHGD